MLYTIEYCPKEIEVGEEYELGVLLPDCSLCDVIDYIDVSEITQGSVARQDEDDDDCEKVILFDFLDVKKINELWGKYKGDGSEEDESIRNEIESLIVKVNDIY